MRRLTELVRKRFPLRCSFCRRRADAVARLVGGASGYICDACVAQCMAVLEQHKDVVPSAANPTEG